MKAVLISIQPKWCELIASGKKTVEVRKTRPKIDVPFKCYIYCTYGEGLIEFNDEVLPNHLIGCKVSKDKIWGNCCNGKVIGEFVCDKIEKIFQCNSGWVQEHACISREEYFKYLGLPYNSHFDSKGAYAWHISDLKIYDKPRELSEFFLARHCFNYKNVDIVENAMGDYVTQYFNNSLCRRCMYYDNGLNWCEKIDGRKAITRPPQSWCYVESEDTE